jgi:SNF2 family DNA or RNA helicase
MAIRRAEVVKDLFLGMEMGTGKTRTLIEILRRRYAREKRLMKTLIICPVIVCDNWKREFAMYSKINPNDIIVLTQAGKKRCQEFIAAVGDDMKRPKIVVTNFAGMLINDLYELIMAWGPEILTVDESQKVKSHQSKTAKKIERLADKAQQRFLLTGTPILNGPDDLWQQFRILDGGETFSKNYYSFRARYFRDDNSRMPKKVHFPKWVVAPGAYEEIQEKIKDKMIRVLKKDCLDLPPLLRQELHVQMGVEQVRMYKEMREEFLTFVKDAKTKHPAAVVAQLAVTKALRLQQILSGYATTEEGSVHRIEDNPRLKALEELLTDITPNAKVIVWSVFKENYKMISDLCKRMKLEYAEIHGDISNAKRIDEMDRFRGDEKCRVMISNQSAGGSGINLVEASYSIYYSKGFSLEHDLQSEARNHRGGSEMHSKITRIDLVTPGTIDELINEALLKKQNVADIILNWKG